MRYRVVVAGADDDNAFSVARQIPRQRRDAARSDLIRRVEVIGD
jgi:hypothetical protein